MAPSNRTNVDAATASFLKTCSTHYDLLVEKLGDVRRCGSAEAIATWLEMTAGFAGMHHPGRFADGSIENEALELGSDLHAYSAPLPRPLELPTISRARGTGRRVLHVMTIALAISGYTKMIVRWIHKDPQSQHSLILTRQGSKPIPRDLLEAVAQTGGRIISFSDEEPILKRAAWLRQLAPEYGEFAILHLIPDDIVPTVAFAENTNMPVALVNLADQCFWLGSTVSDATINLRDISFTTNRELRFTRNDLSLPIPLSDTAVPSRQEARLQLDIPDSRIMLLTVGRKIKYTPSRRQNFFQTASRILGDNPQAHLYIVGVRKGEYGPSDGIVDYDRMHFVGPVADATVYQIAADVYLEGFPFGSQTALLESVLPGVPCVRAVAPLTPLLAASDIALNGVAQVPTSEFDYVQQAGDFVTDTAKRFQVGQLLRKRVLYYHMGESWNVGLEEIYEAVAKLQHAPQPIPNTKGSSRIVDLAISEYHAIRFCRGDYEAAIGAEVRRIIMDAAYSLRQRGSYLDSLQMIRTANHKRWWDSRSVLFAAKLLPHRVFSKFTMRQKI